MLTYVPMFYELYIGDAPVGAEGARH